MLVEVPVMDSSFAKRLLLCLFISEVMLVLSWGLSLQYILTQDDPLVWLLLNIACQSCHWFLLSCAELRSLIGQMQVFHLAVCIIVGAALEKPTFTLTIWWLLIVMVWSVVRWGYGETNRRDTLQQRLRWGVVLVEASLCVLWATLLLGNLPPLSVLTQWGFVIAILMYQTNVLVLPWADPELCRVLWFAQWYHMVAATLLYWHSPAGSVTVPGSMAWGSVALVCMLLTLRKL